MSPRASDKRTGISMDECHALRRRVSRAMMSLERVGANAANADEIPNSGVADPGTARWGAA